jgi:hypothetical protein
MSTGIKQDNDENMPGDLTDSSNKKPTNALVQFYGLYWHKKHVTWSDTKILGQPDGWVGKGNTKKGRNPEDFQVNFWKQKGVYVLYDTSLHPIYVGQGGLVRTDSKEDAGQSIGARLSNHASSRIRNGWEIFSWFGFQNIQEPLKLRSATAEERMNPNWAFAMQNQVGLNMLLDAFEGILIEACSPRFNARGGNMSSGVYVNQYEKTAAKG